MDVRRGVNLPAKGPVSVTWQIIFLLLPHIGIWAFYRIKKLRKSLLYTSVPPIVIISLIIGIVTYLEITTDSDILESDKTKVPIQVTIYLVSFSFQGFAIYLMIKWSREWNLRFKNA